MPRPLTRSIAMPQHVRVTAVEAAVRRQPNGHAEVVATVTPRHAGQDQWRGARLVSTSRSPTAPRAGSIRERCGERGDVGMRRYRASRNLPTSPTGLRLAAELRLAAVSRTSPQLAWRCAAAAPLALLACATGARPSTSLACGVPLTRHLDAGAADSYGFAISTDAAVVVDAADVSGTIGLIKLGAAGDWRNLRRQRRAAAARQHDRHRVRLHRQRCGRLRDRGQRRVGRAAELRPAAAVWHQSARPRLDVQGQVDAYTFSRHARRSHHHHRDRHQRRGRRFEPAALRPGRHAGQRRRHLRRRDQRAARQRRGTYTVLASACGLPQTGLYGIGFQSPACPAGPDITYFGVARADGTPQTPADLRRRRAAGLSNQRRGLLRGHRSPAGSGPDARSGSTRSSMTRMIRPCCPTCR